MSCEQDEDVQTPGPKKRIRRANVHCSDCRQVLNSRLKLAVHRDSGACQRFFCRELNHSHVRIDHDFATLTEAKAWVVQEQLDQVLIIARKGRGKSDIENVCQFLERSDFRGFSFDGLDLGSFVIPDSIVAKQFTTEDKSTVIIYASQDMVGDFIKHPTTLFIDGTHGTNHSKFVFISVLVSDSRGEGTPVMQVIGNAESCSVLTPAFQTLNALAPEAMRQVKVLVSDLSHSFMKAWNKASPELEIQHVACSWHLLLAWRRNLLPQNQELFGKLCQLQLLTDKREFETHFLKLKHE